MSKYLLLTFIGLVFPLVVLAQSCDNEDFETGSTAGWWGFYGSILKDGTVVVDEAGLIKDRHKIMNRSDGLDPIASKFCQELRQLPVVAPGGNHSLRLGNEAIGGDAEKIIKRFIVQPENDLFLLKYAVILNDPEHEPFEQPRFELRVFNEDSIPYPCGEYKVRAAENIPGFETCDEGWRVRSWTTVGIPLNEYLGEEVIIEFLTTDCAQGGHAGYAYVEAACHPFEILRSPFCENTQEVQLNVPDGFASYRWSTGATTESITLNNPEEGMDYSVDLTSFTGCTLTLSGTLPARSPSPKPNIAAINNQTICQGDSLILNIEGENIGTVFWKELESFGQEQRLFLNETTTFTLEISDPDNCTTIEESITIGVLPKPTITYQTPDTTICKGEALQLAVETTTGTLQWLDNALENETTVQPEQDQTYHFQINQAGYCTYEDSIQVSVIDASMIFYTVEAPSTCKGTPTKIEVFGTHPGRVYWPQLGRYDLQPEVQPDSSQYYQYQIEDVSGCATFEGEVLVTVLEAPTIVLDNSICSDTPLTLDVSQTDANYEWHDGSQNPTLRAAKSGTYQVTVSNTCGSTSKTVEVFLSDNQGACDFEMPTAFSPNNDGINDQFRPISTCSQQNGILYNMKIFNRWGTLLFESSDLAKSWDGYHKGYPVPTGVYVWRLYYHNDICGLNVQEEGNFSIIR